MNETPARYGNWGNKGTDLQQQNIEGSHVAMGEYKPTMFWRFKWGLKVYKALTLATLLKAGD